MIIKSKEFGDRLRKRIYELYPSLRQFAIEMGITPDLLTYYLKGNVPKFSLLKKFSEALKISLDNLLGQEYLERQYNIGWEEAGRPIKEQQAPYHSEEENELIELLLKILRGRNKANREAIISNIKAFALSSNINFSGEKTQIKKKSKAG